MTSTKPVGMSPTSLQSYLHKVKTYGGRVDGIEGPRTHAAIDKHLAQLAKDGVLDVSEALLTPAAPYTRKRLAVNQAFFTASGWYTGKIDGFYGPNTAYAIECYQNALRGDHRPPTVLSPAACLWPTYAKLESYFGKPGENLTLLALPYPMRLAWDTETVVNRISVNSRCADSLGRVFAAILGHYSYDQIKALGIDLFGGCFNDRNMRGGAKKSTHAYGAAIDLDPEHNQLRWGADKAFFSRPPYRKMLACFAAEGWVSLGQERNYDWMHFQACQL